MAETKSGKLILQCPECGAKLGVPASASGKRIRCPKCEHRFVADADTPPAAATPVAPPASPSPDNPFASGGGGLGGELLDELAADASAASPLQSAGVGTGLCGQSLSGLQRADGIRHPHLRSLRA